MAREIRINLQPKQRMLLEAIESGKSKVIGYGGAKGGAKSYALRNINLYRRLKYPNTRGLIFRRTYNELNENHIISLFQEFPNLRKYFNKTERILTLPNGSIIVFGYAEYESDVFTFQGKEYADVFIDQAEQLTPTMLSILKGSCRVGSNLNINPSFVLSFNPGGVGHDYLKEKFIDQKLKDSEKEEDFYFIQAHAWDNIEWVKPILQEHGINENIYYKTFSDEDRKNFFLKHADYAKTLKNLPDNSMVEAYLFGRWDSFSGQFLTNFNKLIHVIPDDFPIQNIKARNTTLDYGNRTVLLTGVVDDTDTIYVDGEVYIEGANSPIERAERIAEFLLQRKLFNITIRCDTNMFVDMSKYIGAHHSVKSMFDITFEKYLGKLAPILIPIHKNKEGDTRYRILCNEAVKQYLNYKKDHNDNFVLKPKLFIKECCTNLINTLPTLMFNPLDPLDLDPKVGIQDPYDALKYLVMTFYKPRSPQQEKIITLQDDPILYIQENIIKPLTKKNKSAEIKFTYY